MKFLLTGGGTGGHIYPALSVVREIYKNNENAEVMYVGTSRGLECKVIPKENIPFKTIDIQGLPRKIGKEMIYFSSNFAKGCYQARKIISEFNPNVVLGTGGYVCGPVILMAWLSGIPTAIHEQNVVPGITNKFLSKLAKKTMVSFEDSKDFFNTKNLIVTGNPRASEVNELSLDKAALTLGLDKDKKTLLVVSGSQGAEIINHNFIKIIEDLIKNKWLQIIYVTGDRYYNEVNKKISSYDKSNIKVFSYLNEMPMALSLADLVLSRAGATTLAEITGFGIPSILVPSPNVTNDHQRKNAMTLVKRDAAEMIEEKDLKPEVLMEKIIKLLLDDQLLINMKSNSRELGYLDASCKVYNVLKDIAKTKK
ncbi:undecaprenyldiphospho-muramoylpentapeptide beta-N-acetylglucosaminyltransferase [Natranaerofaba carboxydovora]|uniref:undecaprenyldiphospho-muramoylpentapeptide beta-N-acetylglucosaminyltransferase n=1 Tax=Natranaerofaba carboxydovora TaxID=2742683 RepID=UPI001F13E30D|nr:undecaprenyldiphospho-muramoylpentapeptide beta-N-acetylglucosaminyltransferase [Natranaerofaba carboxydovora]UMZ73258.1 UDP-N-acetylglucosamine--N-acetylmuramyl-(pentapeptide) pyrophosphoryl-undecaprenol N-acetylglucosamine transferase [Natranaerofaba carboxydovora]